MLKSNFDHRPGDGMTLQRRGIAGTKVSRSNYLAGAGGRDAVTGGNLNGGAHESN